MTKVVERILVPKGLTIARPEAFSGKLGNFARRGAQGMHVVFDFDRTLTVKQPGTYDDVTVWHILREHLPDEGRHRYQTLFEKYRALEMNGAMTQSDAVTWFSAILDLFVEYRVNLAAVEKTFLKKANVRPGALELLRLCAKKGIPTIILSAGIRDVIEIWCRTYGITTSLIISTALLLDTSKTVVGWDKSTLVHVKNKSETTHPELLAIRAERPAVLLVGDSLDDAEMAAGEQDVLRVRILDPRPDERANTQEMAKTFTKFDAVITTSSLLPLCELLP